MREARIERLEILLKIPLSGDGAWVRVPPFASGWGPFGTHG